MTENETKLKQCRKDKVAIEKLELDLIRAVHREKKKNSWVAAIGGSSQNRLILNLQKLSSTARVSLRNALEEGAFWVSFDEDGSYGTVSHTSDGLTWYDGTNIIFGKGVE